MLRTVRVIRTNLFSSETTSVPVVFAPIRDCLLRGRAIAAFGIFAIAGTVDLGMLFTDTRRFSNSLVASNALEQKAQEQKKKPRKTPFDWYPHLIMPLSCSIIEARMFVPCAALNLILSRTCCALSAPFSIHDL